jgi:uncharacterized membrane protein (UPF0127 family)
VRFRAFAAVAAVLAVAGCAVADAGSDGAISTDPPTSVVSVPDGSPDHDTAAPEPDRETASGGVVPVGFETVTARITDADGEVCEVCLWLADTAPLRAAGLMGVTDLGDAAGMAFRFEEPTDGWFYMYRTPTPLSIAWFGPDGSFVSSTDMDPCTATDPRDCPLYSAGGAYTLALEVFRGDLADLGVGPGSRLELVHWVPCPEG